MVADHPSNHVTLAAASVTDDLGYVALADIATAFGTTVPGDYLIIGGHMVTALVARWGLGARLYRETRDTDLGSPPAVIRNHQIVERLIQLGYTKISGCRFAKTVSDVPVEVGGPVEVGRQAVVDVLIPTYRTRARQNHRVTDLLVTTEVPGLATALRRPPLTLHLELLRLDGRALDTTLMFPDEAAALVLKALATQVRTRATDIVDIWRCLEVAHAAGVDAHSFSGDESAQAVQVVRTLFDDHQGSGMQALRSELNLSTAAADEHYTRIRALTARVLGAD